MDCARLPETRWSPSDKTKIKSNGFLFSYYDFHLLALFVARHSVPRLDNLKKDKIPGADLVLLLPNYLTVICSQGFLIN